ncbi:MAG: tRNA glutamyl-Q(34) synthetase GluQRS [Mariprofundaceae bacterium]
MTGRLRTRFAPSPTGLLHVGNAFSALQCQQWADRHGAALRLRIEDIDHTRCRPRFARAILDDLAWLGLRWSGPVERQSDHLADYAQALERLRELGVVYPCFCTRREIRLEIERMGLAPHEPAPPYPGLCRRLSTAERRRRMHTLPFSWRLDVARALEITGPVFWEDERGLRHPVRLHHDEVIGRKDIGYSYHLAVVVDDARQGISHVIRGEDLKSSTPLHRLLQALLGLPAPRWLHHPLLRNARGQRLAKRSGAQTLAGLRAAGVDPARLRAWLLQSPPPIWPEGEALETLIRTLGSPNNTT